MSHQRPRRRAGHAQRASPRMWNPNNSRALQALQDRPHLAAQYLPGIKEEEEEDVQNLEVSDSYSSNATEEDEIGKVPGLLLSQTEGHPLFVPEGRRIVNNGSMFAPHAKVDIMLTTLSFVLTAAQIACAAEGKSFTGPLRNQRADNSFWYPLQGMKSDLKDLYNGLQAWSRPIAQMRLENRTLGHHLRTSTEPMSDEERVSKVYQALLRVGDITDSYLHPYTGVPDQLEPVNIEIQKIMFLLTSIVEEGNTLAGNDVETDQDADADATETNVDAENEPFVLDDPLSRPPTPHDPHAPTWKQSLPHLPQSSLYVSARDIKVFRRVLALAAEVQDALVAVVRLCEEQHETGCKMQKVWESWRGFVDAWNRKLRAENEEPRPTGYGMGG